MFTEEMKNIDIIYNKALNEKSKKLFYQMLINCDIYKDIVITINNNLTNLNFNNFAKTQTCHTLDGIFGEQKYFEYQQVFEIKVIGNLITLIISAHRIITCIKSCRQIEKSKDWKSLRELIRDCENKYDNKLRNFMEHLDEKVLKQELNNTNAYFTPERILVCYDEKTNIEFNFNDSALNNINYLVDKVFEMLVNRN